MTFVNQNAPYTSVLEALARLVPGALVAPRYTEDIIGIGTGALGSTSYVPSSLGSVAVGYNALAAATTGDNNVAIGSYALASEVSASNNVAVGVECFATATTGNNTGVGAYAGYTASTDAGATGGNTAVGSAALREIRGGYDNSGVGSGSIQFAGSSGTSYNNAALGARSLFAVGLATDNIAVGCEALYGNISGNQIVDGGFTDASHAHWTAGTGWSLTGLGYADKNGNGTGTLAPTSGGVQYLDYGVGATYTITYTISSISGGSVTASFAGVTDTARSTDGTYTFDALAATYPVNLVFTPDNASRFHLTNVSFVLKTATTAQSSVENVAVGNGALYMTAGGGNYNVAVGHGCHRQHVTGSYNVSAGTEALHNNGSGSSNVAAGRQAGYTGVANSGCVYLGNQAGYYETGSNKLFIDNAQRASEADGRAKALVYGVFDAAIANQKLRINGTVDGIAGVSTAGSFGVAPIVGTVALTGQTGSIGATNVLASAPAGLYVVRVYAYTTTAGAAGTVAVTIRYNNGAAQSITTATSDLSSLGSEGAKANGTVFASAASQNITYETAVAGGAGAQYALHVTLERLA